MADCAQLQKQLDAYKTQSRSIYSKADGIQQSLITAGLETGTVDQVRSLGNQLQNAADSAVNLGSDIRLLRNQARDAGCTAVAEDAESWRQEAGLIYENNIAFLQKNLENYVQKATARAEATQKATTTTNNAGNGTPGSAPSAATGATGATGTPAGGATKPSTPQGAGATGATGADQLSEVTIGSKKPTTPQGAGATGATGASGAVGAGTAAAAGATADQLSEVTVTAPRPSNVNGLKQEARQQATLKDALNFASQGDWRVRLSLADAGKYLYQAAEPGILAPLASTKGILFPYTPSINVSYLANYDLASIQHSNYKIPQYQNSSVESFTIGCDFTAQSVAEANYILAVIHFLRSVTKMFYGKDENPIRGTPPPLCYLTGLGQYQFNAHPLLINSFTYTLPTDVDYIKAFAPSSFPSKNENPTAQGGRISQSTGNQAGAAGRGGTPNPPNFSTGENSPTYVPTKINIQIGAIPVVPRAVMSNDFSVAEYAKGALLLGKYNSSGGGIW